MACDDDDLTACRHTVFLKTEHQISPLRSGFVIDERKAASRPVESAISSFALRSSTPPLCISERSHADRQSDTGANQLALSEYKKNFRAGIFLCDQWPHYGMSGFYRRVKGIGRFVSLSHRYCRLNSDLDNDGRAQSRYPKRAFHDETRLRAHHLDFFLTRQGCTA